MIFICLRFLVLLVLMAVASTASAHDLVIGLSPYQDPASAKSQVKSVLEFMTDVLEPGDSCLIFDAYHIRSLGTFKVPDKSSYRHKKAKLQANRKVVKKLLQFAKQAHVPKGSIEPSIVEAIRLPQALRFIGENYPAGKESNLIILGSPIHDDPKDKEYSMMGHVIPGDGHLTHARNVTPYGIKGQESLLSKQRVHIGFGDDQWMRDDHHGYFVKRFWTLFVERQGGRLLTFTSDLPTLFERVKAKLAAPTHSYEIQNSDKLEMILVRPPVVKDEVSIYERTVTTTPLASEFIRQAPNVEIGLTWEGHVDLDLYAKTSTLSEPISFMNTETSEGRYFKDWMRSPRAINGYETVAFTVPVDLKKLFLAINWFLGKSSAGVKGELRISLDGHTYAKSFHLKAEEGNRGNGLEKTLATRQAASPHWLIIDPLEVIGFDDNMQSLARR